MNEKTIKASGGVVWRKNAGVSEIAIIYRDRYGGEWSLPKGHLDPGEIWETAALREVLEETGCRAALRDFAGVSSYKVNGNPKIVCYWNMELIDECGFTPSEEIQQFAWVTIEEALKRLKHESEKGVLREAARVQKARD